MKLGLFHTAASHVPRFAALLAELAPDVEAEHVVYETLLVEARVRGLDAALVEDFAAALTELAASSDVVLCTCSTFGAHAERLAETLGTPVVRIDRPLAQVAVTQSLQQGSQIVIVAALASTLGPTRDLFADEAVRSGKKVTFVLSHAADAWAWFERGDELGYLRAIAAHLDEVAERGDVIVLAQASMAGAEAFVQTKKSVLSSPKLGLLAAVSRLEGGVRAVKPK